MKINGRYWIAMAILDAFIGTLFCQPFELKLVNPAEIQEYGIQLVGYNAPNFRSILADLLRGQPLTSLEPIIPLWVIVHNGSKRNIAGVGVFYEILDLNGHTIRNIRYQIHLRPGELGGHIPPGGNRFFSNSSAFTDSGSHTNVANLVNMITFQDVKRLVEQMRIATITLDCLIFDDGQFIGPDRLGLLVRLQAEHKAECDLMQELLRSKYGNEKDVTNVLQRILSIENTSSLESLERDIYTRMQIDVAKGLARIADSFGNSAILSIAESYVAEKHPLEVYRDINRNK